ncbi:hypothetical protein X975_11189, partial [Stegodyphus mimosarum]
MTITDHFIRWPEVKPTADISAESTCKVLIHSWIARFVSSVSITTNQS